MGVGAMISNHKAGSVARAWIESWNRRDLASLLELYSEEAELVSPLVVRLLDDPFGRLRGKKALGPFFEKILAGYPHLRFEPVELLTGPGSVAICYRGANDRLAVEVLELDDFGKIRRSLSLYGI